MDKLILFAAALTTSIDMEAGILTGVSVITEGEAKGHKVMVDGDEIPLLVDSTTLSQVSDAITAFGADGVKVKADHWSGFDDIVGRIVNPRIDGMQLRADLHLLKTHESCPKILEMAEAMPSQFGLSIAFSGVSDIRDGSAYARCTELYSVDLVDAPAANPTGLFAAPNEVTLALTAATEKVTELSSALTAATNELARREQTITSLEQALAEKDSTITALTADLEAQRAETGAQKLHLERLKSSLGLHVAKIVPVIPGETITPESDPVSAFTAAFERGDKAEAQRIFEAHKAAIFAARRQQTQG